MKVLIVSNLFPPHFVGGYEIRCGQVARELARRGHDVTVLTSTHGVDEPSVSDEDGITVHRQLDLSPRFGGPFSVSRWDRLRVGKKNYRIARKVISRVRPDIVFAWSQARLSLGAVRAAHDANVPVAWTFGDSNISQYRPAPFRKRPIPLARYLFDNWMFPRTTIRGVDFRHSNCLSGFLKRRLIKDGIPVPECKVIYRGIPVEKFPCKKNVGNIHSPVRVLYVGQLHSHKGVGSLLEAAHHLGQKNGPEYLQISIAGAGHSDYESELRRLAASSATTVEFLGKVPHHKLAKIYRMHDIFVFPTSGKFNEGFGATHLEAMASGTPVIGTTKGGQAELFQDGINALTFAADDPYDLAEKIERLVVDDALRAGLATTARKMVEEQFSIDAYVRAMELFLREAQARYRREPL